MNSFLHWAPRLLSLLFIGFISIFALDVFEGEFERMMLIGFAIHLLPSLALLALTIAAWRRPLVGVVAFIGFAFAYLSFVGLDHPWSWYAVILLPSLSLGTLYLADWRYRGSVSK